MYATGNKKMLNMLILEILRKYSDEKHPLTQQQIINLLKQNYGMECDRSLIVSFSIGISIHFSCTSAKWSEAAIYTGDVPTIRSALRTSQFCKGI